QGVVEIRSTVRRVPEVQAAPQLQALPAVTNGDAESSEHAVAAYRYVALPQSATRVGPALTVAFPTAEGASPAWVSRMVTHTRYLTDGKAAYQTTLTVQNRGAHQIWINLPQRVQLHRAVAADKPVRA